MPLSNEEVEKLAQHYFLTPALVHQAAQLFDLYTQDKTESGHTNSVSGGTSPTTITDARISVASLQQLLMALGAPLSQQDVIEILQLFGTSASHALPEHASATATTAAVHAAPNAPAAAAAAAGIGSSSSSRQPVASSSSAAANPAPATASARKSNTAESRSNTATPGARHAGKTQSAVSARRTNSAPLNALDAETATSQQDPSPSSAMEDASGEGLSATATAAVNLHGMTFPAFVYFLLVYPTIVQHISKHTSSAAAASATTSAFALVDVAELFAQLDSDGDGVCSAPDIRRVAERCATDYDGLLLNDPDLCRLAEMHPVELEEAIREFDFDGDGVVTLQDLQQALQ